MAQNVVALDSAAWALVSETVQIWFEAIKASQPFEDVFGSAYDEHLGKTLGQFFTPPDVSYAIAGFNMAISRDTLAEQLKAGEGIVFGDTCGCGGGSLLLAQIRCFYEEFGAKALHMVCVHGQDLDESMVQLAATQLYFGAAFHHLQIGVVDIRHGNTLTDPQPPFGFLCVYDPQRTQALSAWRSMRPASTPEPVDA